MSNSLRIIIAGGGIGGMAAGLSLLRKGFDVRIFEQAPALTEVGAGVQISPNGSRALDALGAFERLKVLSCTPETKQFRHWKTGRSWPLFDLGDVAIAKYGYPYLTVYRPDLLDALAQGVRAIDPDAIALGTKAVGLDQDEKGVRLTFENGETAQGDILIGADGVRSRIRECLWGGDNPGFSGMVAWRGVIPMESLPEHLRKMVGNTWVGPGGHVVNYPLRGGKIMNFVGTIERDDWQVESWSTLGTAEECSRDFAGWHDDIHIMIGKAPSLLKWALMGRDPMSKWTKGRVTLVGDACHPTLPFLAQGAVMSIEDGVVLGRCLAAAADPLEALVTYENARIARTSRMVLGARDNTRRFHNPELETEESADAYMQREWSREPIKDRYDWLYSYDAEKVAL
nr:salicylate 1-monooxygenase [uncultured bacterium]